MPRRRKRSSTEVEGCPTTPSKIDRNYRLVSHDYDRVVGKFSRDLVIGDSSCSSSDSQFDSGFSASEPEPFAGAEVRKPVQNLSTLLESLCIEKDVVGEQLRAR